MVLWILFAVVTAAVLAAVLAPLARPARSEEADGSAVAVYRDQLEEIDAERARGLVEEGEAAAAKVEISRRLLASAAPAGPEDKPPAAQAPAWAARLALAMAVVIPVLTLSLYLTYGSPNMPGSPLSARARMPLEQAAIGDLVAKVEARLREHPEDGAGWDVIAPVYLKLGRFRDAADAYAKAAQLEGESAKRLAGFASATIFAADGVVTEEARRAFEKLLGIEPAHVEARFWLAVAKEQDGKLADARAGYEALLAEAPPDAPWRRPLAERLENVSKRLAAIGKSTAPGPTAADVDAAAKLSGEDRAKMIAGMVDGLAERLKREGHDLAGWQRLVRSYVVLGRTDDARAALADARRNFGGDDKALAELSALAQSLGLGS
jgi:cytochrome c-type biogenesis protein CcmH